MKRRLRLRKVLFAAIALLIGTTVAVLTVEVSLRVFDPIGLNYDVEFARYRNEAMLYLWDQKPAAQITAADLDGELFRHKPDLEIDFGSFSMRTNALGFRGPEIAVAKPPGIYRVVVLGDSVAFGWGVDEEVSFVRRFEKVLSEHLDRPVEIVNTGNLVYDSTQQLALLRQRALPLDPDLVLLVYVTNDIDPTRDLIQAQFFPPEHPLHRAPDPSEQIIVPDNFWSRLHDGCVALGLTATAKLCYLASPPDARVAASLPADRPYVPEQFGKGPRGWRRSQQALLAMREACKDRGIPFVVLDHSRPILEALPGFCRTNDIPLHPLRFTDEQLNEPIYNSLLDTHANAYGNELLLQKLVTLLPELPLPR